MQNRRTHNSHHFRLPDIFYLAVMLSFLCLIPRNVNAEEVIKVLMLEKTNGPLPSEQAVKVGGTREKVFINGKLYSGSLEVLKDEKGLYVIKNLPLEKYIEGVLVSETKKDWELEALKARAVISRTNANIYRLNNAGRKYHILSTLPHLLYRGDNEDPFVSRAVRATKGEVLTYKGLQIKALFHLAGQEENTLPDEKGQGVLDMARDGKDYREILGYFYPDMTIKKNKEHYGRVNNTDKASDSIQKN